MRRARSAALAQTRRARAAFAVAEAASARGAGLVRGLLLAQSMNHKKLWLALLVVFVGSFAVLGTQGTRIHRSLPPIPRQVVTTGGEPVLDGASIQRGQNVWQSIGGQQLGSIWGHGAYVAPDWSADWLHR